MQQRRLDIILRTLISYAKDYQTYYRSHTRVFAVNALRAGARIVNAIDDVMPNATNLSAAIALLDRVGITTP